jgi:hypothetical protein
MQNQYLITYINAEFVTCMNTDIFFAQIIFKNYLNNLSYLKGEIYGKFSKKR